MQQPKKNGEGAEEFDIAQIDALIHCTLRQDPDTLNDAQWAKAYSRVQFFLEWQESRAAAKMQAILGI